MSDVGFASPVKMPTQNAEMAAYGDDAKLFVVFENIPVFQEFESNKAGRQVYKDMPHIRIIAPGSKSDILRVVRDDDKHRFPRQWAAFTSQQTIVADGLPLEHWPPLGKSQVMEMKAANVYTVEQLANVPDSSLHMLGFEARKLRDLALAYLSKAKEGEALASARAETDKLRAELDALRLQMADIAALQTKRGPGRPRKEYDDAES